jgi:hypothetical protein
LQSGLELPPARPPHPDPPIPLFKIPPAEWPTVSQRVAQGKRLGQIESPHHASYEAVRQVLSAARKELLAGEEALPTLYVENPEEEARLAWRCTVISLFRQQISPGVNEARAELPPVALLLVSITSTRWRVRCPLQLTARPAILSSISSMLRRFLG